MRFIDEAIITVQSGDGGNGCMSFRREMYRPRGGPDGGDGGHGGDVILVADSAKHTLIDLVYNPLHRAGRGQHGKGSDMHGRKAAHLRVHVPAGVIVYDAETGALLVDLDKPGVEWIAAKGGRGGRGNARFLSNANRAPTEHEEGFPGESRRLRLVLKTLADVGLVGFPSAGKSSLIGAVSAAHPKVAAYPFTTLRPNLGAVDLDVDHRFIIADIPGIIEGAHRGAGLGMRFLKHIERTRLLLHILDLDPLTGRDPVADLDKLNVELASFSAELGRRPQLVVANKIDLPDAQENLARVREEMARRGVPLHEISAKDGIGIVELLETIGRKLHELDEAAATAKTADRTADGTPEET
jgi:GTP-binding protein